MGLTTRFGLSKLGGPYGGSLTADGFKFTGRDREVLDRILEALEGHQHSGGTRLADPTEGADVTLDTTGGTLSSGTTYYYRVGFVDQFGLETAASDEVAVATPAPVSAPSAPIISGTSAGGSLAPGVYYYALTQVTDAGQETQLGPAAVVNVLADRGTVVLDLGLGFSGGDYSIWRQGPNEAGYTRIAEDVNTTVGDPLSYSDDGSVAADPCACDPENLPPSSNQTNASNSVAIVPPDVSLIQVSDSPIKKWRVYRSVVSGSYSSSSLVAEVSDIDEDTGFLVVQYTDRGTPLLPGQPLETSQTLLPSLPVASPATSQGGRIFLNDSSGDTWRLVGTADGELETRVLEDAITSAPEGLSLTDSSDQTWRVTVGTDGVLTTTITATPPSDETLYPASAGPHLPSPDPTGSWKLAVDTEGALITYG